MNDFRDLPAFVLNLPSRPERLKQSLDQFDALRWKAEVLYGTKLGVSPNHLSTGQLGALESHWRAWQRIIQQGSPVAAVFEDDVVFAGDFERVFPEVYSELPEGWGVCHLHSFHATTLPLSRRLVRIVRDLWGSHGYLITLEACRLLVLHELNRHVEEILTPTSPGTYGCVKWSVLCFQRSESTDIPETAQLEFHKQQLANFWRDSDGVRGTWGVKNK